MANFGQDNQYLKPGHPSALKDYSHASKTFATNGYELSPKLKFLFHVYFNINTSGIPALQKAFGSTDVASISLAVKTVELPKFKIDTTSLNQYNRKRIIQSKIHYEPTRITFHEDQGDLIRSLWYNYYSYYYKDPTKSYNNVSSGSVGQIYSLSNGFNYNTEDQYSPVLQSADWGYIGESPSDATAQGGDGKPKFFRDITIYGMNQKKYSAWTLINPMITQWNGDTYSYEEGGGTMQNDVTIEYETVKYYTGDVGAGHPSNSVYGFGGAHYDTESSGITTSAGQKTVYKQGSIRQANNGTAQDLQRTGFAQSYGSVQAPNIAYNTPQMPNPLQTYAPQVQQGLPPTVLGSLSPSIPIVTNSPNGAVFPNAPEGFPNFNTGF